MNTRVAGNTKLARNRALLSNAWSNVRFAVQPRRGFHALSEGFSRQRDGGF
jgi:hypothetical protein